MTTKTIHEIKDEHGRNSANIVNRRFEGDAKIREANTLEAGAYLEHLTAAGRMNALRDQKAERADRLYNRTLEDYAAELDRYEAEAQKRKEWLEAQLFGISGPEGAAALSRTVEASEETLSAMLDRAIRASNSELARAVFVEAEGRGMGDLVARYFDHADPGTRDLYAEWRAIEPPEVIERRRADAAMLIPPPDRGGLIPPLSPDQTILYR